MALKAPGRKVRRITDLGTILQSIFADFAGVIKTAESGLNLTPIGALDSAKRIGKNTPILVYNNDTSDHFVTFGADGVSAPSDATDGIPVLAGETMMLNSGDNAWVISDSASVFGYPGDIPNG